MFYSGFCALYGAYITFHLYLKNAMEKSVILKKDLVAAVSVFLLIAILSFGFGYFFGAYDQIEKSKARLEVIPDVNCGSVNRPLL